MEARTKDLAEIASMSAMYDIGEGNTEVMTQVYSGENAPTAAHVYTGDQSLLTISNKYNDGYAKALVSFENNHHTHHRARCTVQHN